MNWVVDDAKLELVARHAVCRTSLRVFKKRAPLSGRFSLKSASGANDHVQPDENHWGAKRAANTLSSP